MATGGHVLTLPYARDEHGKDAKKAYWANKPGRLPDPPWVWTERGEEAVETILQEAGPDTTFWIAADPDREGEFIAWSLERLLEPHAKAVHRVSFQEVTEEAVREALEHPRPVDDRMVASALIRKFLDRLVGYRTSKLARGMIPGGGSASMGRVQTPTLGFVVERELEREAHVPIPYFEVRARAEEVDLEVRFHEPDDDEAWRDEAGRVVSTRTFDGDLAGRAEEALRSAGRVRVTRARRGSRQRRPAAPFTTDALLQAAGSRLGWTPRKTSTLASSLYEAGHITYIRTDSTRLAGSAVKAARKVVADAFGEEFLEGAGKTRGTPETGPVQDAHEAIRPTRLEVEEAPVEDADARKLYRLIRAHTLAAQMAPSQYATVQIRAEVEGLDRPLTGTVSWRTFAGWEAAYREFRAEPATSAPRATLEEGSEWELDPSTEESPNPELVEDETRPPSRYRRHTLIQAMKEAAIGRPSTYAKTVETLEEREYVKVEDGALVPTERGRAAWLQVAPLYVRDDSGTELFSPEYTALMEARLDEVASGGVGANGASGENGAPVDAPGMWERWRDEIRDLHEIARTRKKEGQVSPRSLEQLKRLLANAPDDVETPQSPEDLSEQEARNWVDRLREAGVQPAPTDRQMDHVRSLQEELQLEDVETAELIGVDDLSRVETSAQASALIEELTRLRDERRPPSRKQMALIERLREEADLSETEAAALVDEPDLESLTGGRDGTASALIDRLRQATKATSDAHS